MGFIKNLSTWKSGSGSAWWFRNPSIFLRSNSRQMQHKWYLGIDKKLVGNSMNFCRPSKLCNLQLQQVYVISCQHDFPASINMKPVPWSSLTMAATPMSQQKHPPSKVHKFPGSYQRAADPTESRRTGCCFRAAGQGIPATQRCGQVGRQVVEIDCDSRFLMLPEDMWKIIENPTEAPRN